MLVRIIALTTVTFAAGALAQTRDHAPVAMHSSAKMGQDRPNSESWTYINPDLSLGKYDAIVIKPTAVYKGADAQFGSISTKDRQRFAEIFTEALDKELSQVYPVVPKAGPKSFTLRVTLIGAEKTKMGVATATRVTALGFAANALKSATGRSGTFTGSVLYAVEVHDGATNALLAAAVRRRSPDALDIPSTLSTTDTVKAIARDVARQIRQRLETARSAS